MPLSGTELNRLGDSIVEDALTCYAHTGAPGNAGTANRVGTAQTLAAANWSAAASGDVTYTQAVSFGVLDNSNNQTVTHYSLFRSSAYVGFATLQAAVTVTSGGTFTINANTIRINGATT